MTTEPEHVTPDSVIAPGDEYQYFGEDVPIGVPIDLAAHGVRMRVSGPLRGDWDAIARAMAEEAQVAFPPDTGELRRSLR